VDQDLQARPFRTPRPDAPGFKPSRGQERRVDVRVDPPVDLNTEWHSLFEHVKRFSKIRSVSF
jgi:hypothetical protein